MSKIFKILAAVLFFILLFKPQPASAATITVTMDPFPAVRSGPDIKFTFQSDKQVLSPKTTYILGLWYSSDPTLRTSPPDYFRTADSNSDGNKIEFTVQSDLSQGDWHVELWQAPITGDRAVLGSSIPRPDTRICPSSSTTSCLLSNLNNSPFKGFILSPPAGWNGVGIPALAMDHSIFWKDDHPDVYIVNADPNMEYRLWFNGEIFSLFSGTFTQDKLFTSAYGDSTKKDTGRVEKINMGSAGVKNLCMTFQPYKRGLFENTSFLSSTTVSLHCDFMLPRITVKSNPVLPEDAGPSITSNKPGIPTGIPTPIPVVGPCATTLPNGSPNPDAVCKTGLGDIATDPAGFVKTIFGIILSLAGGTAVLLIIMAGYKMMASQGNPEKLKEAQESLTSAIVGLLFIIFSITILQIIGVDILHIPGINP